MTLLPRAADEARSIIRKRGARRRSLLPKVSSTTVIITISRATTVSLITKRSNRSKASSYSDTQPDMALPNLGIHSSKLEKTSHSYGTSHKHHSKHYYSSATKSNDAPLPHDRQIFKVRLQQAAPVEEVPPRRLEDRRELEEAREELAAPRRRIQQIRVSSQQVRQSVRFAF